MISRNPTPEFTPLKPDFKCKFSVKTIRFEDDVEIWKCAMLKEFKFPVICDGSKESRETCPFWE